MQLHTNAIDATTRHSPVRLYCDAATDHQTGVSSIGIVCVSHGGRICDARGQNIGRGYGSQQAEVEAMERALDALAGDRSVQHVTVVSDCHPAVSMVGDRDLCGTDYASVGVEWVPRVQNRAADLVAELWVRKTDAESDGT